MGDTFTYWSGPTARTEYEGSPHGTTGFARPSAKSIYNQRKDYGQTLLKPQSDFQHHVEHLLTLRLERELRSTEDCVGRLRELDALGKVWGQELLLGVRDQELLLSDVESREELDSFPLSSVQGCLSIRDVGSFDSVLAINVQEKGWGGGSNVLLFQCHQTGAETLKSSLEKLVQQRKEEQRQNSYGNAPQLPPDPIYSPASYRAADPEHAGPRPLPPIQHKPPSDYGAEQNKWMGPNGEIVSDPERDVLVLNHVLGDMEQFMGRLRDDAGSSQTPKKKKKKKKKKKDLPSKAEYVDFYQKVKYSLNLLAYNWLHIQAPPGPNLLENIFQALTSVLELCPYPNLAAEVETPLLLPETLQLLDGTLLPDQHRTWKSLGMAWNRSRSQYPNADLVPRYIPTFSDGWLPPPMLNADNQPILERDGPTYGDAPGQLAPPQPPAVVRVLYEFQGRNPQELSVRMGDTLQVLDQQKKWWLVRSRGGAQGYVPSNIVEPAGHDDGQPGVRPPPPHRTAPARGGGGGVTSPPLTPLRAPPPLQSAPPSLHMGSSPAEVTAWLKDKGFAPLTVRCLGVLGGRQLLQMTAAELRAVCPEEWRRLLFKLSPVRSALGIGPND
ncbi:LOW QUALITY PROTEIN: epidermal growth factor receptor kinase substrate 8-like protein 3 [Excalfactoria chinensis]|uniref:LOW QUALITY PROTEIN: epidermal growth factor receptor kinase substrate 8-like protein 3 n=1 Tax=Excalfactoria chinensis TaxID=46218 RepID=UPI003B3B3FBF